jgi:hypothetical protein
MLSALRLAWRPRGTGAGETERISASSARALRARPREADMARGCSAEEGGAAVCQARREAEREAEEWMEEGRRRRR